MHPVALGHGMYGSGWGMCIQGAPLPWCSFGDRAQHPSSNCSAAWDAASGVGSLLVGSHICPVQQIGAGGDSETHPAPQEGGKWGMTGAKEIFTPWRNNNFSGQGSVVSVVPLLAPDTCLASALLLIQS